MIICDSLGALYERRREGINKYKRIMAKRTNPRKVKGSISQSLEKANVLIGLSRPNLITPDDIQRMARNPVVFALSKIKKLYQLLPMQFQRQPEKPDWLRRDSSIILRIKCKRQV